MYRQFLLRIVFNLLVEQRQRFRRFVFQQIEIRIGKDAIFPDRFGICDELDGAMHVAKRESVERETDVEPHVRDEPTRKTFLFDGRRIRFSDYYTQTDLVLLSQDCVRIR